MGKHSPYENIAKLVSEGRYDDFLFDPLDYKLMEQLPKEGTLFGGLYQVAENSQSLSKKFPLTPAFIGARLRIMAQGGLLSRVRAIQRGSRVGFQITSTGEEVLKAWQQRQST